MTTPLNFAVSNGLDYLLFKLKVRITSEQMEEESKRCDTKGQKISFGYIMPAPFVQKAWDVLKTQMAPTDELWWYDDIGFLSGTAGYAIVRDRYLWSDQAPTIVHPGHLKHEWRW